MNAGVIWWGQIGNSLRLLTKVTNALRDCHSAVLQVPTGLPWRQSFYEAIDIRRSAFSGERRLVRLRWEENTDPGEFVLRELCSKATQAEYWPGLSYAEYLASLDDIVLNDYYVWITEIHNKSDLVRWVEFLTQYTQHAEQLEQRAIFVLEYDGVQTDVSGVEKVVYSVESYDCRVFCLEAAATLCNSDLRAYQAELALCIGGNNPELNGALLEKGSTLLLDPVATATDVTTSGYSSDGMPFLIEPEQKISSAAWKAAIGLLFPILEQYRLDFISGHERTLARHLPISNSNGDRITDPYDLEIGAIQYIVGSASKEFSPLEVENIRLCRKARNLLAHNKLVPYADVKKILDL